ncbi:serine/threonine protein kinase [Entomoplasma ellychniae]|uniref:non-specific serine/threonine protein kinase n=1 Tax=Entomoplasma ellychniae TaxID=2114 RepID=A0A8E2QZ15_9MOLU|nr:protein kinase [Entomoplasma ellychniae]PPE04899.1 serine/threonine protein kinase [Entomoplasma ellychniae]
MFLKYNKYEFKKINKLYKIISILHKSSTGNIYLGEFNNQKIIVKEYRPYTNIDSNNRDSIFFAKNSIKIREKIKNLTAIPKLIDYFWEWENFFIVEEYIEAKKLSNVINHRNCFFKNFNSILYIDTYNYKKFALQIFLQIFLIYQEMRKNKIFHGDFSLENILLNSKNNVYLIDFDHAYFKNEKKKHFTIYGNYSNYKIGLNKNNRDLYSLGCIFVNMFKNKSSYLKNKSSSKKIISDIINDFDFSKNIQKIILNLVIKSKAKLKKVHKILEEELQNMDIFYLLQNKIEFYEKNIKLTTLNKRHTLLFKAITGNLNIQKEENVFDIILKITNNFSINKNFLFSNINFLEKYEKCSIKKIISVSSEKDILLLGCILCFHYLKIKENTNFLKNWIFESFDKIVFFNQSQNHENNIKINHLFYLKMMFLNLYYKIEPKKQVFKYIEIYVDIILQKTVKYNHLYLIRDGLYLKPGLFEGMSGFVLNFNFFPSKIIENNKTKFDQILKCSFIINSNSSSLSNGLAGFALANTILNKNNNTDYLIKIIKEIELMEIKNKNFIYFLNKDKSVYSNDFSFGTLGVLFSLKMILIFIKIELKI